MDGSTACLELAALACLAELFLKSIDEQINLQTKIRHDNFF